MSKLHKGIARAHAHTHNLTKIYFYTCSQNIVENNALPVRRRKSEEWLGSGCGAAYSYQAQKQHTTVVNKPSETGEGRPITRFMSK